MWYTLYMRLLLVVVTAILTSGCIISPGMYQAYLKSYDNYLYFASRPQKACELKTRERVTLPAGLTFTCYQGGSQVVLRPPDQPDYTQVYRLLDTTIRTSANLIGVGIVANSVKQMFEVAVDGAGHNTSIRLENSYNTDNSVHDSLNQTETTTYTDSYNTDNSINNSYNVPGTETTTP